MKKIIKIVPDMEKGPNWANKTLIRAYLSAYLPATERSDETDITLMSSTDIQDEMGGMAFVDIDEINEVMLELQWPLVLSDEGALLWAMIPN